MNKIKILVVLGNTGRGGAQSFAVNLLRIIDKNIFQMDFVFDEIKEGYEKEIRELGSLIYVLPRFKIYNFFHFKKAWANLLTKHRYDIVHGHVSSSASIYLRIAKKHNTKTILHSHSAGYRGNAFEVLAKKLFSITARNYGDYWFACSDKAALRLFGKDYFRNNNFYEIPNAINTESFLFSPLIRKRIREELKIKGNCKLIGHIGSITYPKNHEFLIDVFREIKKKNRNTKLIIVGDGPLEKRIKRKACRQGLSDSIVFVGNKPNPNEYLMAFDLLLFPSRFEGLPLSIVEAQASGLPVLMSDKITDHVILTDLVHKLSIDEQAGKWAEKACLMSATKDRCVYNSIIKQSLFDVDNSCKLISNIYKKMME